MIVRIEVPADAIAFYNAFTAVNTTVTTNDLQLSYFQLYPTVDSQLNNAQILMILKFNFHIA